MIRKLTLGGNMKKLIIFLIFFVLVFFSVGMVSATTTNVSKDVKVLSKSATGSNSKTNIIPICTAGKDQSNPKIYGDNIIWVDYRNAKYTKDDDLIGIDIYKKSLSTGKITRLTYSREINGHTFYYQYPEISGNYVTMNENWDEISVEHHSQYLGIYNLKTGTFITATKTGGYPEKFALKLEYGWPNYDIDGNLIVTSGSELSLFTQPYLRFYIYVFDISKCRTISTIPIPEYDANNWDHSTCYGVSPQISGNLITWWQESSDNNGNKKDSRLYLYDLSTKKKKLVALYNDGRYIRSPSIQGNIIAYELWNDKAQQVTIWMYNNKTNKISLVAGGTSGRYSPVVYGSNIFYVDHGYIKRYNITSKKTITEAFNGKKSYAGSYWSSGYKLEKPKMIDVYKNILVYEYYKSNGETDIYMKTLSNIPVAEAGNMQQVYVNDKVTLNGTKSTPSGQIRYVWNFWKKPNGSNATLKNFTSAKPYFVPDIAGEYIACLHVINGKEISEPDYVKIVVGNKIAYIFGADTFKNADPKILKNLQYVNTDLWGMNYVLRKYCGFNKVVVKPNFKFRDFIFAMDYIQKYTTSNDLVLIYYSGHGGQVQYKTSLGTDKVMHYIVPSNADTKDLWIDENDPYPEFLSHNLISEKLISYEISKIKSRDMILVLDCCYSGGIRNYFKYNNDKKVTILTSSSMSQKSAEFKTFKHGIFTYYFIQALKTKITDKNKNKQISAEEAFQYAAPKVYYYTKTHVIKDEYGIRIIMNPTYLDYNLQKQIELTPHA